MADHAADGTGGRHGVPRGRAPGTDRLGIVFDIDDTLYLERDYARSGFRAVGAWAAERGLAGLDRRCWNLFERGVRGRVFDEALEGTRHALGQDPVGRMVALYRAHRPAIALLPDVEPFLERFAEHGFAAISDGPLASQSAKVEALGLRERLDLVLLTDAWGPAFWKPHPRAFAEAEHALGVPPERMVYIADNPAKDFLTPNARGWLTIGLERPGRLHAGVPPSPAHAPALLAPDLHRAGDQLARVIALREDNEARRSA